MSTKTMFKRIALATVSALGLGTLGVVAPASAAITSSFTVPVTSVTVVTDEATYDSRGAHGAIFKIVLNPAGSKASQTLEADETLTASVVAVPAGTAADAKTLAGNASDLVLVRVDPAAAGTLAGNPYSATALANFVPRETSTQTFGTGDNALDLKFGSSDAPTQETTTADFTNSYYMRVVPAQGASVIDQGEYQIRLRLTSANGGLLVQDTTVRVRFVSSPIGAGFTLSATAVGNYEKGGAAITAYSATRYLSATLRDANGGRVVDENTYGAPAVPSLTADLIDVDGLAIAGPTITQYDDGSDKDFGYSSAGTAAATNANNQLKGNNVYGFTTSAGWLDTATTNASGGSDSFRVRYGDKVATAALTILSSASTGTASVSVSATGLSNLSAAPNWTVPLTTTSATVRVANATAGSDVVFTVTWSGAASGDVTPTSAVATTVVADSSGVASLTVTNSKPVNGATATVAIAGFSSAVTSQVITWRSSTAATMSVSMNGAIVALKSTNTFVATVTDHFGAPVAGVVLTPSLSATGSNGSSTATYASVTTNDAGQASYTFTDAKAVAAGTDTVTFTHVASSPITAGSSTITYAATAPAPTTLTAFYSRSGTGQDTVAEVSTPVPTAGIYETPTSSTPFQVVIDRNNQRAITASATADHLTVRIRAVKGAGVTATAPAGAFILGASNFAVSSRTLYGDANGDVYFVIGSTKTGANTVTFTSGSVSTSVSFWMATSATKARFITMTGDTTATANGEPKTYTVKVTDRYGNPVSGVQLSLSATGAAVFSGGANLQTFTTGSSGEFTFGGTSFNSAGGSGTFTASFTGTGTDATSAAGFVGSTPVESTLAAGNSSASVTVTFAAGQSAAAAAAEAASDAALEAIDAANAATDAANLAAEAADAATVAAEEARDAADAATAAVEALASEVATLIAGLKAQITTLANTVAKIAKRVRA